ncbi:uncharacterized protein DNG_02585 [Cephalotrichum gorgonifer]|uniref:NAD(P)-binding domain-containing protein n=1 Tax=Cephalotrichum gorgonifer TaxID=2041049 RepID=A0AAE8MTB0_9PEZI|nr:uncharacterized protein DNG_02585 [Cephalotrichum gorgonifer]
MKLIIGGATGFLGSEVLRQSLRNPAVTSVIALGRRPATLPDGADAAKLKNIIVEDFRKYPEDVRKEFEGADACIWTIAVLPADVQKMSPEQVKLICTTYAVDALQALSQSSTTKPLRYIYVSGSLAERDQTVTPRFMPEYCLMRGEAETDLLHIGEESKGSLDVCIVRPAVIVKPGDTLEAVSIAMGIPVGEADSIGLREVAAAMLNQAVNGVEKDTLENEELKSIGKKALEELK